LTARARSSLAVALLFVSACVHFDVYRVEVVDTLYFGTMKADGSSITDAQWKQFVSDIVAPRLAGFTTWDAEGLYHTNSGAVQRERTHVVQVIRGDGRAIAEIIAAYKKQFAQESVLRLRGRAGVAFQ
jgi:Protein of unknown function (DUF3574)